MRTRSALSELTVILWTIHQQKQQHHHHRHVSPSTQTVIFFSFFEARINNFALRLKVYFTPA